MVNNEDGKDQLQTDRVMFRTSDPLEHWRGRGDLRYKRARAGGQGRIAQGAVEAYGIGPFLSEQHVELHSEDVIIVEWQSDLISPNAPGRHGGIQRGLRPWEIEFPVQGIVQVEPDLPHFPDRPE